MTGMSGSDWLDLLVRDVADFPKPGVIFKDITPVLANPAAFATVIEALIEPFRGSVTKVAALEARGFIVGAPAALMLEVGFVPLRKPGKLPFATYVESYDLEYGSDSIEMHIDALESDDMVLIVDDVIATGGTARAAINLINKTGATIVGLAALMEVAQLRGRELLGDVRVHVVSS
jgi:adenine phosphoribosyltransferase